MCTGPLKINLFRLPRTGRTRCIARLRGARVCGISTVLVLHCSCRFIQNTFLCGYQRSHTHMPWFLQNVKSLHIKPILLTIFLTLKCGSRLGRERRMQSHLIRQLPPLLMEIATDHLVYWCRTKEYFRSNHFLFTVFQFCRVWPRLAKLTVKLNTSIVIFSLGRVGKLHCNEEHDY